MLMVFVVLVEFIELKRIKEKGREAWKPGGWEAESKSEPFVCIMPSTNQ